MACKISSGTALLCFLPLVAAIPTCLLHWATGNPFIWASLPPVTMLPVVFLQILVLGGPLNEELGWRGWALPEIASGGTAH